MADDKKVIFSMVGVSKTYPPQKQVLKKICCIAFSIFFYTISEKHNSPINNLNSIC